MFCSCIAAMASSIVMRGFFVGVLSGLDERSFDSMLRLSQAGVDSVQWLRKEIQN